MSSSIEGLKSLPLLGGYDALELWPTVNLTLLTWALLIFAPRWKHTPNLTLIAPVVMAVVYTLALASLIMTATDEEGSAADMTTLEGVVGLFKDPNGVFVGWVHYCVYDPLVGRWILMDSVRRGSSLKVHVLVMVPVLIMACLFAPVGWLMYVAIVRPFVLVPETKAKIHQV